MSVQQDRLTFIGVLAAVVVVVVAYLQLGRLYPTAGRAHVPGDTARQVDNAVDDEGNDAARLPGASDVVRGVDQSGGSEER